MGCAHARRQPRASWDDYFMSIAQVVATRSTCPRKYVGSVLVRNRTILSTGYNGSIRGMPHCSDVGHMMEDGHCVATIHAEANAIIQAARNGVMIDGATIYVTASPCWNCFKQLANAGIVRIVLRRVLSRRADLRGRAADRHRAGAPLRIDLGGVLSRHSGRIRRVRPDPRGSPSGAVNLVIRGG